MAIVRCLVAAAAIAAADGVVAVAADDGGGDAAGSKTYRWLLRDRCDHHSLPHHRTDDGDSKPNSKRARAPFLCSQQQQYLLLLLR